MQKKFSGDSFQCAASPSDPSGALVVIPMSKVNDDYCDCPEGDDEPGTSACPDGRFWCSNKGATSKWLHSAAVGDGVCDCCDATDEPPSTGCQHTCREEGAAERAWRIEELQRVRDGLKIKAEYTSQATVEARDAQLRATQLQGEVATLKATHATIEKSKTEAEVKEEETKKRMRETEGVDEEKEKAEKAEEKKKMEEAVKAEKEAAERAAAEQEAANRNERHAAPMANANERHAAPPEEPATDDKFAWAAKKCVGSVSVFENEDFTGWQADFDKGEYHFSKFTKSAKNDEASGLKVPAGCKVVVFEHGDYGGWQAEFGPGAYTARHFAEKGGKDNDASSIKVYHEDEDTSVPDTPDKPPPPPPPRASDQFKDPEAERLRTELRESQNKLTTAENELREVESRLSTSTNADLGAYNALRGKCFELRWQQYKYEVCPFSKVTQDHTSLGTWDKFAEDGTGDMLFANGQSCWSGPSRSARVEVACGVDNVVLSAEEPERCTYLVKMKSPAACTEERAKELEALIGADNQVHDDL